MKIYVDGKYYGERDAKISVFDHGLLYGDGVFEGIRAYHGRVFKLKEHIDRLFASAKALLLMIPMSHKDVMAAVVETCRRNNIRDGYVRLVVTPALSGSVVWNHPAGGDGDRCRIGFASERAEPDPVRHVQCGRMFFDRDRGGIGAGGED